MDYYALQVKTGDEANVMRRIGFIDQAETFRLLCPTRTLRIRRRGKTVEVTKPVFGGYVFLSGEESPARIYLDLKRTEGIFRFLPSNVLMKPLADGDLAHLKHFMSFVKRSDISKVSFDANDRIVVHSGALKGYEGMIIRVDRRKGRARIRMAFCEGPMTLDLSFDVIEKRKDATEADDGGKARTEDLRDRSGLRGEDPGEGDRA
jgi:transcription termination/antitermination protein NusG